MQARLPLFLSVIRSQSNNWDFSDVGTVWVFFHVRVKNLDDHPCGLQAVHNRHILVHEYDLVWTALQRLFNHLVRLLSIAGPVSIEFKSAQYLFQSEQVEFVIIRHQNGSEVAAIRFTYLAALLLAT